MPVAWNRYRIGELGRVITGRTPPGTAAQYFGGEVDFLTPSDFDGGRYVNQTARTLSPAGASELNRVLIDRGVAVSCIGWQMGKAVIIRRRAATNQQINTVIPDETKVSILYLYYSLAARRDEIFNLGASPTRTPIVNKSTFEKIEILVPDRDEQRRITDVLGALDDKIELNRKMNATLEQIAQTLFKSWFVDFDPVKAKSEGREPEGMDSETAALFPSEFEDSPLGPIPKGWKIKKVGEIARRVAMGPFGSRIKTDNFVPEGVPVIRGNNLTNGFNENAFVYLTEEKADELRSSNAFPGDIVFTHRGTLGQVGLIPAGAKYPLYVVSQSQMLLAVDTTQVSPKVIYRFFISPAGQSALLSNTSQTGVPAIAGPTTSLKAIRFACPPRSVSDAFERVTASIDSKRQANTKQSETLASIRDLLLPRLISGKLRIPEAEQIAEAVL